MSYQVHSYGGGLQSITILDMYVTGILPRPDLTIFLHESRLPLDQVPFENPQLQPSLFENECAGMCFV
jgi:hypothetical protein